MDVAKDELPDEVQETVAGDGLDEQGTQCIKRYTMGSMAVGVIPFPVVDMAALAALQLKMLHTLAKTYDVEFKTSLGRSAISSLVGGLAPVYAAAPFAASLSKFIPIVGHTVSYGSLVMLNGASTYAVGRVFQQHFASGGTFLTFDPESVRGYFAEQYEKGKQVVASLKGSKKDADAEPAKAE